MGIEIQIPDLPIFEETLKLKQGITTPALINEEEETNTDVDGETEEQKLAREQAEQAAKVTPAYLEEEDDKEETETEEATPLVAYVKGILDLGVLNLPENFEIKDDFNEVKLQELLAHDAKVRDEDAQASLQSRIKDPKAWEIIDHALKGGAYADVAKFFELQQEEQTFENIDLTNPDNQELIVLENFKRLGMSSKRSKDMLDLIIANDELEKEAAETKLKFVNAAKEGRKALDENAKSQNDLQVKREEEWRTDFYKSLDEKKFKQEKKTQILSSFDNLKFADGRTAPRWRYKMMQIENNPSHFMELLDLLTLYDPAKGFEALQKKAEEVKETTVVNTVYSKLQAGAKGFKTGAGNHRESDNSGQFIPINPADRHVSIK